jgi:aliphatic nitrilase
MGDQLEKIRLAAVQASSVLLDRDATVEKACALIREAGAQGADLIGFPEGFIPAHPSWFTVKPATGKGSLMLARRLFQNSVVIPSAATDRLGDACREARITAVIGMCEKRPGTTGTMFNTQLFIGPDGNILGKHQKLVPTVGERLVHTGGAGDTLRAYETPFGMVSGLICAENSNPLATQVILGMYPVVHVAAWPAFISPALDLGELVSAASRGLAYAMGCFVINSTSFVDDETIAGYEAGSEEREFMERIKHRGCASIIGPRGQVLTEPLKTPEGIVYADVDLNDVLIPKLINDFAGHYNRPDVFSLHVNTAPPALVQQHGAAPAFRPLQQPGASDNGFMLSDSAAGTAQIGHLMPPKQLTRKEKK